MIDQKGIRNTILHLIGVAGTGKLTIAKEIAERAPFRILDNHLVSNPVFSVLELDGKSPIPPQVRTYTNRIWQVVFDAMLDMSPQDFNFIFTNVLVEGHEGDRERFESIRDCARKRGSRYFPVRLLISDIEEHKKRITDDERADHLKTVDPVMAEKAAEKDVLEIEDPHLLNLDVTHLSPEQAAKKILAHIGA